MIDHANREYYLFKLEAVLTGGKMMTIIVVADADDKAFTYAENHLLRHTIVPPKVKELSIVQKQPIQRGGVGYVVETSQFT